MFYAIYSLFMKIKIPKEREKTFNFTYLLGFMGVFNLLVIFPVLVGLDVSGWERFNWPDNYTWGLLLLNAFLANFLWDYCYLRSVMLLGPLLTNTGLCLSFPLSMIIDVWVYHLNFTWMYFIGSACVFTAFAVIMFTDGSDDKLDQKEGTQAINTHDSRRSQ